MSSPSLPTLVFEKELLPCPISFVEKLEELLKNWGPDVWVPQAPSWWKSTKQSMLGIPRLRYLSARLKRLLLRQRTHRHIESPKLHFWGQEAKLSQEHWLQGLQGGVWQEDFRKSGSTGRWWYYLLGWFPRNPLLETTCTHVHTRVHVHTHTSALLQPPTPAYKRNQFSKIN